MLLSILPLADDADDLAHLERTIREAGWRLATGPRDPLLNAVMTRHPHTKPLPRRDIPCFALGVQSSRGAMTEGALVALINQVLHPKLGMLTLSDRQVDLDNGDVILAGGGVGRRLTAKELDVLRYMVQNVERVVKKHELIERIWGAAKDDSLYQAIKRLRAKIETDKDKPAHLIKLHGVGYRFVPHDVPPSPVLPPVPLLLGRQTLIARAEELLSGRDTLTLLGPGGVGKTSMALHLAHRARDNGGRGAVLRAGNCYIPRGCLSVDRAAIGDRLVGCSGCVPAHVCPAFTGHHDVGVGQL